MIHDSITALSDLNALQTLAAVVGELADETTPQTTSGQLAALNTVLEEFGFSIRLEDPGEVDEATAAAAARELLALLAADPNAIPVVEEWTRHPPVQETAAIPEELTTAIVVTACVVVLQIVSHLSFSGQSGKGWKVSYDPTRRTPLDSVMLQLVGLLARICNGAGPPPDGPTL